MSNNNEKYIKELEETVSKFLKPIAGIPFHIAIKALYKHKVISVDLKDEKDRELIEDLKKVAQIAGKNANRKGIFRNRPNEVGNDIEIFVKDALGKMGFTPETPMRADGVRQAVGYPDIYFKDKSGRHVYFECKTYNKANINTTQRAFYFSPSRTEQSKIIFDAYHIVLSFEIKQIQREGKRCFIPVAWKLVSIHSMKVDVKHEFNASNREIYRDEAIIAEGEVE